MFFSDMDHYVVVDKGMEKRRRRKARTLRRKEWLNRFRINPPMMMEVLERFGIRVEKRDGSEPGRM